jgi:hypothetical protein
MSDDSQVYTPYTRMRRLPAGDKPFSADKVAMLSGAKDFAVALLTDGQLYRILPDGSIVSLYSRHVTCMLALLVNATHVDE